MVGAAVAAVRPSALFLWLLRWLLFRLMLESGCVKLLSGDPTWWHLTALRVHYETQPLPDLDRLVRASVADVVSVRQCTS